MKQLKRKLQNLFRQGSLAILDDDPDTQTLQIELQDGETVEDVERLQQYGFESAPTKGGVYVVAINGSSNQLAALCINDDDDRLRLPEKDDVAMYHREQHHIRLTKDGEIIIECKKLIINAEDEIEINTKKYTLNADTLTENISERATTSAPEVTLDTPKATTTGNHDVAGTLSYSQGLSGSGGGSISGDLNVEGDVDITGTSKADKDHQSLGVSLVAHTHSGVASGGANTGKPNKVSTFMGALKTLFKGGPDS